MQILNFDSDEAQENALKCIFDSLCFHGFSHFEQKTKIKRNNENKQNERNDENKENSDHNNSQHSEDNRDENEITIIDDQLLESDFEDTVIEEEYEESFIDLFTDLLIKHLYSESDNIRLIVAKGIAKLFILGIINYNSFFISFDSILLLFLFFFDS